MFKTLIYLLFSCLTFSMILCEQQEYTVEGLYDDSLYGGTFETIARFLPYNPEILRISEDECSAVKIKSFFPKAHVHTIVHGDISKLKILTDVVWIDCENPKLPLLCSLDHILQNCTVIYLTTNSIEDSSIQDFLEKNSFILVCRKRYNEKDGYSIYLKRYTYEVILRSLSHSADMASQPGESFIHADLASFLRPAKNKDANHSFLNIDFIYMINLDERPEKYAIASKNLAEYGIYPFRFSGVNGWKLPNEIMNQIGVRFATLPPCDLLSTVYRFIDGKEYKSYEYIKEINQTYFCYGLTRGAIGIILSHLSILKDAYDSGYETIWVMEDDVLVIKNPNEIQERILELDQIDPTWDILFTDVDSKDKQGTLVPCRAVALRPNFKTESLNFFLSKFYKVSENLSRCGMRYGAYSMIIRRSGIEKILNFYKNYQIYLPYDMDFWIMPSIKMYCPNYEIVSTIPLALSDNYKPDYEKLAKTVY